MVLLKDTHDAWRQLWHLKDNQVILTNCESTWALNVLERLLEHQKALGYLSFYDSSKALARLDILGLWTLEVIGHWFTYSNQGSRKGKIYYKLK